ncbi:hypothetical protein DPEC_G00148230 [Dallia pectoralis]|uniref:Uncharacterized protein n=1 Tax=Dallia pectoralis TaxID=75939 RepID=A0ACC2GIZ4_DALPE|nr:hypothetical protein DPEC_G00148230 [Dallia pectoralis]
MPQFPAGGAGQGGANQAEGVDYRNNLFVPAGMEAAMETTETYETINPNGKKTFCTFGKERRDHTILVANVKPYLKTKRALSPLLQEVPSASSSPTKGCASSNNSPCASFTKSPADGAESKPTSHYCSGPPDGQYLPPSKQSRDPGPHNPHGPVLQGYPALHGDPVAKVLAEARSRISQEAGLGGGTDTDCVLEMGGGIQGGLEVSRDGVDADQVVRDIDKLLLDCRGSETVTGTLRRK